MRGLSGSRRTLFGLLGVAVVILIVAGAAISTRVFAASSNIQLAALPGSALQLPKGAVRTGGLSPSTAMTVEVELQQNDAAINAMAGAIYNPSSPQYHHFLSKGEFNRMFGPSASATASVRNFLTSHGLKVSADAYSPFMIRASGSEAQVSAAFHTSFGTYRAGGQSFWQNDGSLMVPASLKGEVLGVLGTTNSHHLTPQYITTKQARKAKGLSPTFSYGGGPGCSGLTPSQVQSIYGETSIAHTRPSGKGAGRTLAVVELSGYTRADIAVYESQFGLPHAGITDSNVDCGPLTPCLPLGDFSNAPDYSGDIEVNADIEAELAVAPKISNIIVYNAPNDFLGLGPVDEYFQIAADDSADSVSSSWASCEFDATFPYAAGEFDAFRQMALQGQSMFASSGDSGAYSCLRGSGFLGLNVLDPSSQPWVTAVGGTSFGTYDPQSNPTPSYPTGSETVWNPLDLCDDHNIGDIFNCVSFGASGGGNSIFWGDAYQTGSDVGLNNPYTLTGKVNFTSPVTGIVQEACQQQATGKACRTTPDVSANADEFTPYAEYCTGNPLTNSTCAFYNGWLGIGGTSLSSPVWAAIFAIADSHNGHRVGFGQAAVYWLHAHASSYTLYFHDMNNASQTEKGNGFYPDVAGYDLATGIGTPNISNIAYANP